MADERDQQAASLELVMFMNKITELIEQQLGGVRGIIEDTVCKVMDGVREISDETSAKAGQVDKMLEKTYFNPDQATESFVNQAQGDVDLLFEMAKEKAGALADSQASIKADDLDKKSIRRLAGQFSKNMEAVGTMDEQLSGLLIELMGSLSNDDLIRQKLEHIHDMVHALQVGLSYILIDFKNKFTQKEVETLKKDLLWHTYSMYTSEIEKDELKDIFGKPEKVPFSIFR